MREKMANKVFTRKTNYIEKLLEAWEHERLTVFSEYYRRPDFNWVSEMIDAIYANKDSIDEIANSYKVEFEEGGDSPLLIPYASYENSDDTFHIWLNNKAIESIKSGKKANDLKREIESFLWHEETHRQQNQLKNAEQPYIGDFDSNSFEERKAYLSQYCEIDAFARSVAADIWKNGADSEDIANLKNLKMSFISQNILKDYQEIDGKIYQKFLQEIYRWYNEPYVGGRDEYRQWLKGKNNGKQD
jgi:hypothetical protein